MENDNTSTNTNGAEGNSTNDSGATKNEPERVFTQAEVNRMMKAEKEKGRCSILKELGVEDVKNAKDALQNYQQYLDNQKTDLQRATDNLKEANDKLAKAEIRAQRAELSLQAISSFGAVAESVEDLISIAITKISDDKDIATVLKEMKENKAYSGFFNNIANNQGTGNPIPNAGKPSNNNENYGAMLAKRIMQKNQQK